jgi:hypothetical protein
MTPIDQWSKRAFGVTLEGDLPTPIESVTLARASAPAGSPRTHTPSR